MDSINVSRTNLIAKVKENLIKHEADFQEALKDHAAAMINIAADNKKIAAQNAAQIATGNFEKLKSAKGFLPLPVSYAKEYNRALAMLQMSVDENISVEQDVFNQLVLDEWQWKHNFVASNSLYKTLT